MDSESKSDMEGFEGRADGHAEAADGKEAVRTSEEAIPAGAAPVGIPALRPPADIPPELAENLKRWEALGSKSFWGYLGCQLEGWNDRQVTASLEIRPELLNLGGILHGGVHASLIDSIMGMLIMITRGEESIVTTNLNMHYLSSTAAGRIYATAEIVHTTRRSITAEAYVRTAEGEKLAFGTATFRIVGPPRTQT